jgi:hypothetical protein
LKTVPFPETYRGRIYDVRRRVWYFADGSGSMITEEAREEELRGLVTLQEDNMETARRLFHPSDFEQRKR